MAEDQDLTKRWVITKLFFHWLTDPCRCHVHNGRFKCVRCLELPYFEEAFPAEYAFSVNAYQQWLDKKAQEN